MDVRRRRSNKGRRISSRLLKKVFYSISISFPSFSCFSAVICRTPSLYSAVIVSSSTGFGHWSVLRKLLLCLSFLKYFSFSSFTSAEDSAVICTVWPSALMSMSSFWTPGRSALIVRFPFSSLMSTGVCPVNSFAMLSPFPVNSSIMFCICSNMSSGLCRSSRFITIKCFVVIYKKVYLIQN